MFNPLILIESFIGLLLTSSKGYDSKLLHNKPVFTGFSAQGSSFPSSRPAEVAGSTQQGSSSLPPQVIEVTSPECGPSPSPMLKQHTPSGDNHFPHLTWTVPGEYIPLIKSFMLIVQDPDAPLPIAPVHGIFYDIPVDKREVVASDFEAVTNGSSDNNMLKGGFRYGKNLRGTIYGGPRPVCSHGPHRYAFMVIGLGEGVDTSGEKEAITRDRLEKEILVGEGKVVCWGLWWGTYENKLFG
ncbi:hypothetical protein MMC25_007062 [Agyrium rufum]|nr:hypothetical protein [Agyrium rufum]